MNKNTRLFSFLPVALLLALGGAGVARAATFDVSTTAELEAAVASANALPGADTINPAPGLYTPSATLVIADDLTINGSGPPGSVIDGSGLLFSVFIVSATSAIFNALTIRNGGEGIQYANGTATTLLRVDGSTITANAAGIAVGTGAAEIVNSTISGNDIGYTR